ncbi:MobF family relaxase [Dyadobacter jiangsuensis]
MIRMIMLTDAAHAKAYYQDALSRSDYYVDDQERPGVFHGKLADRLGIAGMVDKKTFDMLCDNINPSTGNTLTQRNRENRVVGYDINFHVPKSLSAIWALSKDDHIIEAFDEAVIETMQEIEANMQTRVRKGGVSNERGTDELMWAHFTHTTARPVKGQIPDPHIHSHCTVFSATFDNEEQCIKAGYFRNIMRDMPYYQAKFHKRLSDRMVDLGYEIKKTRKAFEIEGVPQRVIDHLSKRTSEIGRAAKSKGITDAKALSELGARTRSKKMKGLSMLDLKAEWKRQIQSLGPGAQGEDDKAVRFAPERERTVITAKDCIDHTVQNGFERASVIRDRRLLLDAYKHAIGHRQTTIEAIDQVFEDDLRLIKVDSEDGAQCTTHEVLTEERRMVALAKRGQGKLAPIYNELPEITVDGDQANAIKHLLKSTNRTSIVRGAAGTGKTTLMKEAVSLMENAGKRVTVVAPSAQASRGVLRDEGFKKAQTVSKLLEDTEMQNELQDQILWVDEAGLLGNKDMIALLELTEKRNARLVLGGDTRQHSSVLRGDALRILNKIGGIQSAEVHKIYRQQDLEYKQAVEHLANGRIGSGFEALKDIGAFVEVDPENLNKELVSDYLRSVKDGRSALIISPTHEQGDSVTEEVRSRLKDEGLISLDEQKVRRLKNLNLTEAQKADWRNIDKGNVIQFNQHTIGITRGSVWTVSDSNDRYIVLENDQGMKVGLPTSRSKDYDVFQDEQMNLAAGDTIRVTRNGLDKSKSRLNNGQLFTVTSIDERGEIELLSANKVMTAKIAKDFGHITHAHCITSHASQGKTVDDVFVCQPAATFGATNAKQMYVSVSRGRKNVRIYTEDKASLMKKASKLGDRDSALELVRVRDEHERVEHNIRNELAMAKLSEASVAKQIEPKPTTRSKHHEPGL